MLRPCGAAVLRREPQARLILMRILVADDEPTLRTVMSQVLTDEGHEVTTAPNGEEALDLFRANPFQLVVTDIVMGRMSGIELLIQVRDIDPECLVVVMT